MEQVTDWIRIITTVTSFVCFVAWMFWFLKKDNKGVYQERAQMLLDDDDTTPAPVSDK